MRTDTSCSFPYLNIWKNYCDHNRICAFIDSVISGYAQLAFNDHTISGILMLIATWIGSPLLCINALWGTIVATAFAYFIHLPNGFIRSGLYGANAALSCLAAPVLLFPSQEISIAMIIVSTAISITTVLLIQFLEKYFTKWELPSLVTPYCIILSILLIILSLTGIHNPMTVALDTLLFSNQTSNWTIQEMLTVFLNSASQILWLSRPLSGILYLIAITFASKSDTLNTCIAIIASLLVSILLGLPKDSIMSGIYGYNAILLIQVLSRNFLFSIKNYILIIFMSALTPVVCCIYQLILPHFGIGSFLALPYLTLVYLVLIIKKNFL